jgi:hypothetical protein
MHLQIALAPLAGVLYASAPDARADFASYVAQYDLQPLYPARPKFGSGTVFRIERVADGSRYTRVLCRSLFAGDNATRTPIALKSMEYTDPERFNEAIGIVYGLLANARQTEENLVLHKVRAIKLSYADTFVELLPRMAKVGETNAPVELDATCLTVLTKLKQQGEREPIYVVDRALRVGRFVIHIDRPPESTLDASHLLDTNSEFDARGNGMDEVEIDSPYYLAMSALLIEDIGPAKAGVKSHMRVVKTRPAKVPEPCRAWQ